MHKLGGWWTRYRRDAIDPRWFVIRSLHVGGRGLLVVLALLNVVLGALPIAFIVSTSVLVGRTPSAVRHGVGSAAWGTLVTAFLLAAGAFFALQLLAPVASALGTVLRHRINGSFRDRLIELSLRSPGVGPLEDQEVLANLSRVSEQLETGWYSPGDAAVGTLAYIARYTALTGYIALIWVATTWWAAVGVAACAICFRFGHRTGLRLYMRLFLGPHQRRRRYFRGLGIFEHAAKEMRVFGLTGWAIARHREAAYAALLPMWAERRRMVLVRFLYFTAFGLVVASVVLALVVRSAAEGELTLTALALALQASFAAILLGDYYPECDNQSQFGMIAADALEAFANQISQYANRDVSTGVDGATSELPREEIRFADVSFTYAGSTRPVLDGLDFKLRAGECTALVGLNGAGKTTLVKLLARLYEPTSGKVLVDGRDVRDYELDSWRRQLAVIFQDFNRYELSAADNISFGAVEHSDPESIRLAAVRAGIAEAVDELPNGMNTLLSRQYTDGAELSGGQWQRVAIARALHAVDGGARVLVMDEPTAALDVRAEAAFFERFSELTSGLTTLLISHRFSSVRHADRIVVLEGGRVIEDGTHDSLIASGGRYADLFALQAQRFAAGLDADGEIIESDATS